MNLSLPAAPAGSGSVGGSACGDVRALPSWEVLWPVTGSVWLSWMERLPVPCLFPTWALGGLPFTHLHPAPVQLGLSTGGQLFPCTSAAGGDAV